MFSAGKSCSGSLVARRISILVVLVICLMTSGGLNVKAQTIFGRISGTVRDNQGGVVPNATVTMTNPATNLVRTATTDEDGFYTVTNLPVGTYTILVARDGFKKAQQHDIVLSAD